MGEQGPGRTGVGEGREGGRRGRGERHCGGGGGL